MYRLNNLSNALTQNAIVSDESDMLILVDADDQEVGSSTKEQCHDGEGILHRAFSVFMFNAQGELLLQQRSQEKRLWPLYWSNSCCSHPRFGETIEQAALKRAREELGVSSDNLQYLYKFHYQASFGTKGSEHELCSVYIGNSSDVVMANVNEVANWRYLSAFDVSQEIDEAPETFTPWFKMEWQHLIQNYSDELAAIGVDVVTS